MPIENINQEDLICKVNSMLKEEQFLNDPSVDFSLYFSTVAKNKEHLWISIKLYLETGLLKNDSDQKILFLDKILKEKNKDSIFSQIFYYQRGWTKPSIQSGTLKEIQKYRDEIEKKAQEKLLEELKSFIKEYHSDSLKLEEIQEKILYFNRLKEIPREFRIAIAEINQIEEAKVLSFFEQSNLVVTGLDPEETKSEQSGASAPEIEETEVELLYPTFEFYSQDLLESNQINNANLPEDLMEIAKSATPPSELCPENVLNDTRDLMKQLEQFSIFNQSQKVKNNNDLIDELLKINAPKEKLPTEVSTQTSLQEPKKLAVTV